MVNRLNLLLRCLSQLRALHNVVATLSSQNQAWHKNLYFPTPMSTLAVRASHHCEHMASLSRLLHGEKLIALSGKDRAYLGARFFPPYNRDKTS
jgi:hypothetical protein